MGTDITAMVEVQMESGEWTPVIAPIWPNSKYGEQGERPFAVMPALPRHYGLFALLADVRNRTGRGTVTMMTSHVEGYGDIEYPYDTDDGGHEPLIPLAMPRGVPADANGGWKGFCSQHMIHDPSWFTLKELEGAAWDQVLEEQAVVLEDEYLAWRDTGAMPRMGARGVGGPGMKTVTVEEYEAGVRGEQTAVDFRWVGKTLYEDIPNAWWATLSVMKLVAPEGDEEKVRLLVAFDS